jgi:hypothetical protein
VEDLRVNPEFANKQDDARYRRLLRKSPDDPEWGETVELSDPNLRSLGTHLTFAHVAALKKELPAGFDRWELSVDEGWTVAHYAAMTGYLPEGFDRWHLLGRDGISVIHTWMMFRDLPEWFDDWGYKIQFEDKIITIAHLAAMEKRLPSSFDQWELMASDGYTVAHYAILTGVLPPDVPDEVLELGGTGSNPTVAQFIVSFAMENAESKTVRSKKFQQLLQRVMNKTDAAGSNSKKPTQADTKDVNVVRRKR